jgi:hypothetical protein
MTVYRQGDLKLITYIPPNKSLNTRWYIEFICSGRKKRGCLPIDIFSPFAVLTSKKRIAWNNLVRNGLRWMPRV